MRPLSREALARQEAAKLAAATVPTGDCAGRGARITELEAEHRRGGAVGALGAVAQLRAEFCHDCPALLACANWAAVQEYTGLAAGAAYVDGVRLDVGKRSRRRVDARDREQPAAS